MSQIEVPDKIFHVGDRVVLSERGHEEYDFAPWFSEQEFTVVSVANTRRGSVTISYASPDGVGDLNNITLSIAFLERTECSFTSEFSPAGFLELLGSASSEVSE